MISAKSKIVLFDDSETNSTMGKHMLEPFFDVYFTPTIAGFFEILEMVTPDLILLNMEFPEFDRDEIMRKIKGDNRFAHIPVILLSPQSVSGELEGIKLGAADYITKPFSWPFLLKRIANQLLIAEKDKVTALCGK